MGDRGAELVELYRTAWRHSDESIAVLPRERRRTTFGSLHADIVRELIDGRAGGDHDDIGDAAWWAAYTARVQAAADHHRQPTGEAV